MRPFPRHNALWLFYRAAFALPSKQFDGLYNWLTSAVGALRRQTCLGIELFLQVAPISGGGWESTEGGFAVAPHPVILRWRVAKLLYQNAVRNSVAFIDQTAHE